MSVAAKNHKRIAQAFVAARLASEALSAYPGARPEGLEAAYRIQDLAIPLWPTNIGGWRVGQIKGALAESLGANRLLGPIFENAIIAGDHRLIEMPVYAGGFAAVEAEIVFVLGLDAPTDKIEWSLEQARDMIGSVHAGIEIASSPYSAINQDGPLVTISDFGNNRGLILGSALSTDSICDWCDIECVTEIDGKIAGQATPRSIIGGPLESMRQALENTTARDLPMRKGMVVSSGAVTGVHEVKTGSHVRVQIADAVPLECRIVA